MVGVKLYKSFALSLIFLSSTAKADVLFEGYARILAKKEPIGYAISKYEFDAKKKRFYSTTFLKTETPGGGVTESLKATADEKLRPISYSYTSIVGKDTTVIDAKFTGNKMTAMMNTGGKAKTIRNTLPPNTILSTFLVYSILSGEKGLKANTDYEYVAIAEEDGQVIEKCLPVTKAAAKTDDKCQAIVLEEVAVGDLKAYKIKNNFKGFFTSYVTARGEILATSQDDMSISTELVADPAKATTGFTVNKTVLKALFGEVPEGKNNILAKSASISPVPAGKLEGVPQGQGIQIKGEPATK